MRIYFPRIVAWLSLIVLAIGCAAMLSGCSRKLAPHTPPQSEPIGLDTPPADTTKDREFVRINSANPAENGPSRTVVVQPHRSLLDKVLGRTPKPYVSDNHVGNIGKKSTVSVYYGPATVSTTTAGKKATAATAEGATATTTGKKSGPAVIASDSSTLNAIEGGGNLAAVNGDGNDLELTKQDVTTEAPGIGATIAGKLAGPPGIVLGVALAAGLVYLLIIWRKRKAAENLV